MPRAFGLASLLAPALFAAACATVGPPVPTAGVATDASAAWERVLDQHVTDDGRIDFVGLRAGPRDLEAYVAWAAVNGPRSTPERFATPDSRLAYWLNTYNAVAMYLVVSTRLRPEALVRFFILTRIQIDGEATSLYALENSVIRPLGDPRIHFALNCMARGCPRLPRAPFTVAGLPVELERETRRFLADPRNVQIDPPLRTVRFNSILRFYTEDFLPAAPSLAAYANRYRDEKIPEDYRVRFIPYDWTLNQK
jgi:hypothetical protein